MTPVQFIKGVGPHRAKVLQKLGLKTVVDILFFFPRKYEDYTQLAKIDQLSEDKFASVEGVIEEVDQSSSGKHVTYVLLKQESEAGEVQYLRAMWFNQPFMFRRFQAGQRVVFQGKPRLSGLRWEMVHPKFNVLGQEDRPTRGQILPVYRLVEGINQTRIRQIVGSVVETNAEWVEEVLPDTFIKQHDLIGIHHAIRSIHAPANQAELESARFRLVFQELMVLQLALAMRRFRVRDQGKAVVLALDARIRARILRRFPFEFTDSQLSAIDEIAGDMARRVPMNRLLHGDVGSGKTAVAVFAMLLAVAHGHQSVIMSPTEILARQHARTIAKLLKSSRVRTAVWTGSMSKRQREEVQTQLKEGAIDILIGTQALVQSQLEFKSLALAIVDEQHKFGVSQRAMLRQQTLDPHYLVMTATPIPRTIAMTAFGDLDVTTLKYGSNRKSEVHTYLGEESRREQWWEFFRQKLREGRQGYVVAPLVTGESRDLLNRRTGYASAEALFESLVNGPLADFRVDIVHGRQTPEEKDAALLSFARGHTQVLVATTVIEVGIDVPNATLMTIESAERFGISQLHQLRGRVGRGELPGYVCVFADIENDHSARRIQAFVDSNDGFQLAEKDLELRGPGNLFGTQQHGMPPMRIADLVRDSALLERTQAEARRMIDDDPNLTAPCYEALRAMVVRRYGASLELSDVG